MYTYYQIWCSREREIKNVLCFYPLEVNSKAPSVWLRRQAGCPVARHLELLVGKPCLDVLCPRLGGFYNLEFVEIRRNDSETRCLGNQKE
jgi:hypothetical protein